MRQPRITVIMLTCFFSLVVGSRSSMFAQQPPQTNEKERGIELYHRGDFNEAVKSLQEAVKKQRRGRFFIASLYGIIGLYFNGP